MHWGLALQCWCNKDFTLQTFIVLFCRASGRFCYWCILCRRRQWGSTPSYSQHTIWPWCISVYYINQWICHRLEFWYSYSIIIISIKGFLLRVPSEYIATYNRGIEISPWNNNPSVCRNMSQFYHLPGICNNLHVKKTDCYPCTQVSRIKWLVLVFIYVKMLPNKLWSKEQGMWLSNFCSSGHLLKKWSTPDCQNVQGLTRIRLIRLLLSFWLHPLSQYQRVR